MELCEENNFPMALSEVFAKGGKGGVELANKLLGAMEEPKTPNYIYDLNDTIENKINLIAKNVYGAKDVVFVDKAAEQIKELEQSIYKDFFICMAKTPYALNDGSLDPNVINIKSVALSSGAGFLVVKTGDIMTMPGLPSEPMAQKIDFVDGLITGMM